MNYIDILKIWDSQLFDFRLRCDRYYRGEHRILMERGVYSDGKPKSRIVTNFVADMVDGYVGALTGVGWQVTDREGGAASGGVLEYRRLYDLLQLGSVDAAVLRDALVGGWGVEVHSFDGEPVITAGNGLEWVRVEDARSGAYVGAIRRYTLPVGTLYDGVVLERPVEFLVWYDDSMVVQYRDGEKVFEEGHSYGRVPVVFWRVNESGSGVVTESFLSQQDEYNSIDSASGDEIRAFVDSIMCVSGVDPVWLQENSAAIREKRILPLGGDESGTYGSAFYLTRNQDVTPSVERLRRVRSNIHMIGKTPDTVEITGVTGDTSGIALKLRFMPMQNAALGFVPFLRRSFRERVELINAVNRPLGRPEIGDYVVTIQFTLPTNRIEEWTSIGALTGIVSRRKQLELLSDVDDPERELAAVDREPAMETVALGGRGAAVRRGIASRLEGVE